MVNIKRVSAKFNSKNPFDFTLCIVVIVLLSMGILMVLSASAPSSLTIYGNSYTYVLKQLMFAIARSNMYVSIFKI